MNSRLVVSSMRRWMEFRKLVYSSRSDNIYFTVAGDSSKNYKAYSSGTNSIERFKSSWKPEQVIIYSVSNSSHQGRQN